jgi:TolB-like protein/Flp pilus assembly protein TadD
MKFLDELKRRNVFRVGIAYAITAWLLLQLTEVLLELLELPPVMGKIVVAALLLGFPVALLFAWAFELTPEGVKRDKNVNRDESIAPQTGKRLDRMIIIGLVAVIVVMGVERIWFADTATPEVAVTVPTGPVTAAHDETGDGTGQKSIAVLPFVNMSADAENEYFSDGIAEELLNVLVRVSSLEVASRTSSFAYKGKNLPLSQVARELGVNHILEGSVRKAGNRVRVTAQLIDANSDRHLWSDTYERELDDIFDIQVEISDSIVAALKVALNVEEVSAMERLQRPTNNPEAYELYLQGRFLWRKRMEENIRGAIELLEKAVALDPNFAKAYEALAAAWTVLPAWSNADPAESLDKAVEQANQALMLDPNLAEARAIRAHYASFNRRWLDSLIEYEAALESEPKNAGVRQWYSENLAEVGYLQTAMTEIDKAYQLDPASPIINNVYSMIATIQGDDALAIRHMEKALDLGLTNAWGPPLRALIRLGEWDTVERLAYPVIDQQSFVGTCIEAHRNPSLYPEIRKKAAEEKTQNGIADPAYYYCKALVGDVDEAFAGLEAVLANDPTDIKVMWSPDEAFVTMRQSPRFKQVLKDNGLLELYKVRGWPDRCRPAGAEDFVCD